MDYQHFSRVCLPDVFFAVSFASFAPTVIVGPFRHVCVQLYFFFLESLDEEHNRSDSYTGKHVFLSSVLWNTATGTEAFHSLSLEVCFVWLPMLYSYCLRNNNDLFCSLPCSSTSQSLIRRKRCSTCKNCVGCKINVLIIHDAKA